MSARFLRAMLRKSWYESRSSHRLIVRQEINGGLKNLEAVKHFQGVRFAAFDNDESSFVCQFHPL